MQKQKVLIVEDEKIVSIDLRYILHSLGYEVLQEVSTGIKAIEFVENNSVDAVLMDIGLKGDIDGIDTAIKIKSIKNIPIIFVTANSDEKTLQKAKKVNPEGFILKPFNDREIRTTLEIAIFKHGIDLKLKESEEWFSTTLKSIGDAVIATDKNGNVKFMNHVAEELTGWEQDEARGKPLAEVFVIINEYTRKTVENPVDKVFKEGQIVGLANHTILISKNGTEFHIDDAAAPIKNHHDEIDGVVLTFRDITDKKIVEYELFESQNRFSLFMNNSPLVSWIKDPETWNYVFVNKKFTEIFNYDLDSLANLTDKDIFGESIAEEFKKNDLKALAENKSIVSYENSQNNGEFKRWLVFKFPILGQEGKTFIAGSAIDISENKELQDKLKYNEEFLKAIFDESYDACFLVDYSSHLIINCNKKALEMFEIDNYQDLIGKTGKMFHNAPNSSQQTSEILNEIDTNMSWIDEIEYKTVKGNIFWGKIRVDKFTALNKEYNLVRISDVTELRKLKNKINNLKNSLVSINQKNNIPELEELLESL